MTLSVSISEFEVIQANLNLELVIPALEDLGLLSLPDKVKLVNKSQKPAVKLILKKAKQHSDGSKLFRYALEQTKADEGHKKILQVLRYHVEDLSLQGKGEYEVVLYIDNVEANNKSNVNGVLMAELTKNGINCKVCKLQVGDFLWVAKKSSSVAAGPPLELVLDHIIERKRMDDLSKSIIDRRFTEQKFRLAHCGIHHVIYLIEEYGDPGRFSIPASSLNQAITNTQVIDGFYIRRTRNIKDTVAYLTTMTRCIQRHYSGVTLEEHSVECVTSSDKLLPPAVSSGGVVKLMSFTTFSAASVKSKVMMVTEMFAKHLIQIPGFSAEKAEAVIAQFPTPTSLFKAYSQCSSPPEKLPLLLEHIKHGRRNRNLGKSLSMLVHDLYWSGHLTSSSSS